MSCRGRQRNTGNRVWHSYFKYPRLSKTIQDFSKTFQDYPRLSNMGASSSKTILITKPAQSGKDRSVVQLIKEHQMTCDLFSFDEMVTFIFHGLTKSLGGQKSSRMAADSETLMAAAPSRALLRLVSKTATALPRSSSQIS